MLSLWSHLLHHSCFYKVGTLAERHAPVDAFGGIGYID